LVLDKIVTRKMAFNGIKIVAKYIFKPSFSCS